MDHNFTPSFADPTKCAKCKWGVIVHTDLATCEACPNVGKVTPYVDILLCTSCLEKELKAQEELKDVKKQQARVDAANDAVREKQLTNNGSGILNISNLLDKAKAIDFGIQVRQDIFNAETIALHELFTAVDADETVPAGDKQFKKAEITQARQVHFQKVVFDANQQVIEAQNHLRVLQSELNKIVNTLRTEDREKLKIIDPNYKPGAVKSPKATAKPRPPKKPKFDKKELMDETAALIEAGYPATLAGIQGIVTSRDMTPKQAAGYFKKMIDGH